MSQKYEPKTRNRQLALLDSCLRPQLDGVGDKVIEQLTAWEQDIEKYDCVASTAFADDLKITTLMRAVSDQTRAYLVQIMTGSASSVIRESIRRYVSAQKSWAVAEPMDVGAFGYKGGKKGKSGGKGKTHDGNEGGKYEAKGGQSKGNGKKDGGGKSQRGAGGSKKFDGNCRHCGKYGHREVDCWAKQNGKAKVAHLRDDASGASGSGEEQAPDKAKVGAALLAIEEDR